MIILYLKQQKKKEREHKEKNIKNLLKYSMILVVPEILQNRFKKYGQISQLACLMIAS